MLYQRVIEYKDFFHMQHLRLSMCFGILLLDFGELVHSALVSSAQERGVEQASTISTARPTPKPLHRGENIGIIAPGSSLPCKYRYRQQP